MPSRAALLFVLLARASAHANDLDIGEKKFVAGRTPTDIAVCGGDVAVSVEKYGPRVNIWRLPDGDFVRALGPFEKEWNFVACEGGMILTGHFDKVALWIDGMQHVAKLPADDDVVGGTFVGGKGYVLLDSGHVYEVTTDATKKLWKGGDETLGFRAIVRPDLAVTWDGTDLIWATPKATTKLTLPAEITAVADVGDGIAIADKTGNVRVLTKAAVSAPLFKVNVDTDGDITAVGGNAKWIAAGTYDSKVIQLPRTRGATPVKAIELIPPRMSRRVETFAIAGDRWLVATDDNRIYPLTLGATSYKRATLDGHDSFIWSVALDATSMVTASSDGTAQVRSATTGALEKTLTTDGFTSRAGLTATHIWAFDQDRHLYRWTRKGFAPLTRLENVMDAVALDDKRLALLQSGKLFTLDVASGKLTRIGTQDKLYSHKLAARKDLIALYSDVGSAKPVSVVDLAGKTVATLEVGEISAITFSHDASRIAVASDERLSIWTRKTNKVAEVTTIKRPISALAFATDGRLAAGDWDGIEYVFAPGDKTSSLERIVHTGRVDSLAWFGTRLASAGSDYRVKVTDTPAPKPAKK